MVTQSFALIIVNTKLNSHKAGVEPLMYPDAEKKGQEFVKLMMDVFSFDDHKVCVDYSREQIRGEYKALEAMVAAFEKDRKPQTVIALSVIFVGHKLSIAYHAGIINKMAEKAGLNLTELAKDGTRVA